MVIVYIFCTRLHRILTRSMKDTGTMNSLPDFFVKVLSFSQRIAATFFRLLPQITALDTMIQHQPLQVLCQESHLPRVNRRYPHPENKHYPPEKLMVGRWFYFEMVLIFRGHVNFQGVYTKEIQCGICCPSKNNISLHFFFLHMFIYNAHSSLHLYVKYSRIYVHSSRFKHSWVIDKCTQQWIPSIIHPISDSAPLPGSPSSPSQSTLAPSPWEKADLLIRKGGVEKGAHPPTPKLS